MVQSLAGFSYGAEADADALAQAPGLSSEWLFGRFTGRSSLASSGTGTQGLHNFGIGRNYVLIDGGQFQTAAAIFKVSSR